MRLVDVEPLEKYLAGLINLARRDEVGIRFPSVDAWKAELEHLKELPTINPTQRWISVKDLQPRWNLLCCIQILALGRSCFNERV